MEITLVRMCLIICLWWQLLLRENHHKNIFIALFFLKGLCVRKEMLQDARFPVAYTIPRGGGGATPHSPPRPPARAPARTHTPPAPPPTHVYQGWANTNFESWGYHTLANETQQSKINSVPIDMCTLAIHLKVVLALWKRFSNVGSKA